jgi:sarcosine oxidase/L-pipecolate oxidase
MSEVENIIKALKPKDAKGYDDIPIKVLKWCTPFISSPITYIFKKSIQMGIFPSRLQYPTTIPIYKSGNKLNMSNFRPISILICFSKIFEKIIYNRIYSHITMNNILTRDQFGFRNNVSTDNASYTLLHKILTALENKHKVGGIFCDLTKVLTV